jgi:hypothetical protein
VLLCLQGNGKEGALFSFEPERTGENMNSSTNLKEVHKEIHSEVHQMSLKDPVVFDLTKDPVQSVSKFIRRGSYKNISLHVDQKKQCTDSSDLDIKTRRVRESGGRESRKKTKAQSNVNQHDNDHDSEFCRSDILRHCVDHIVFESSL